MPEEAKNKATQRGDTGAKPEIKGHFLRLTLLVVHRKVVSESPSKPWKASDSVKIPFSAPSVRISFLPVRICQIFCEKVIMCRPYSRIVM